jgi:hypothetical protein
MYLSTQWVFQSHHSHTFSRSHVSDASTHPHAASVFHLRTAHFVNTQLAVLDDLLSFFIDFIFYRLSMSSQINAHLGIDPNTHAFASLCQAVSLNHYWKSRFCDHLNYQRITRTHRTYTARYPCVLMGLIAEVVIHLTLRTHYCVTNHYDNTNAFPHFWHPARNGRVVC